MELDIIKNELLIQQFYQVHRTQISKKIIPHTSGRVWDGFILILEGRCRYTFSNGRTMVAEAGQVLYLAKDALYQMEILTERYRVLWVDFLFHSAEPRQSAIYCPRERDEAEHLFYRLFRRHSIGGNGAVSDCLSMLYRLYAILLTSEDSTYLQSETRRRMEEARNQILEQYASEELTVGALAQRAGMSEVYFRKLFRGLWGTSPARYIVDVRLKHAKELMGYSYLSLEDIALQTGFSSLSYFCRIFKERIGMSPGEFRRKM